MGGDGSYGAAGLKRAQTLETKDPRIVRGSFRAPSCCRRRAGILGGVADTTPQNEASSLSDADVRRLARLARLAIPDAEIPVVREQLAAILRHADTLRGLELGGVEPMTSPMDATAPMRDDVPGGVIGTDVFLRMAPESTAPFLRVPKVIGDGSA